MKERKKYTGSLLGIGGLAILVLLAALTRSCIFFYDSFATGYDGYYYVLQVDSLQRTGSLLIHDTSIVYYLQYAISIFMRDIVVANKVTAIVFGSLSVLPYFLTLYKIRPRIKVVLIATLMFALSYSYSYIGLELQKNNIALFFFVSFLCAFVYALDRKKYYLPALLFFVLALFSHKLMGGLLVVFLAAYVFCHVMTSKRIAANIRIILIVLLCLVPFVLILIVRYQPWGLLRMVDLQLFMNDLRLSNYGEKINILVHSMLAPEEKIEMALYHIIPFAFFIYYLVQRKKMDYNAKQHAFICSMGLVALFLVQPFLKFGFDTIAGRLLLLGFVPVPMLVAVMVPEKTGRNNKRMLWLLVGLILLLFYNPWRQTRIFHAERYPDYKHYYPVFKNIPLYIGKHRKIIAHKGISSFIWAITGLEATHFLPEKAYEDYYRIVYGLSELHFETYYANGRYQKPVELEWPYLLVHEPLWQKFYKENKEDYFILESWRNPMERRPETAYFKKN